MKKNANFTKILNKSHENKWVALSPDRYKVLGSSDNLVELKDKVNNRDAVYMKVQPSDISFAF
ncbi:hypothetical protein HZA26_02495 [Candidatus Nomurabacteria bacterium]|nr:hypothetical protein [Candidatus Nomurabacteria bacterium]